MPIKTVEKSLVGICVFLSGMSALVYQVVWAKYVTILIGSSGIAQAISVALFLGGLSLGSWIAGRQIRARHSTSADGLQTFAYLEMVISVAGMFSYQVLSENVFLGWCLTYLFCSAALMGATLPYVARGMGRMPGMYALNSIGAAYGALVAGFSWIPKFGLDFTTTLAAAINAFNGVLLLFWIRRKGFSLPVTERAQETTGIKPAPQWLYLWLGISGFVSLGLEVVWFRLGGLLWGSSVHTFCIVLSACIAGIALGSWIVAIRNDKQTPIYFQLGFVWVCAGIFAWLTLPIIGRAPYQISTYLSALGGNEVTYEFTKLLELIFTFGVVALPFTWIGMTVPIACAEERNTGTVLAVTAAGNVLGAVLVPLWILPFMGVRLFVIFSGIAWVLLGVTAMFRSHDRAYITKPVTKFAFGLVGVTLWWSSNSYWSEQQISSGPFRDRILESSSHQGIEAASRKQYEQRYAGMKEKFHVDGAVSTISVEEKNGIISLRSNGKPEASTGSDMGTQILCGQLPMLLRTPTKAETTQVMLVGLGSGITAGSVLTHPTVQLDVAEISKEVAVAAGFFAFANHDVLKNPRLSLHVKDARNFLRRTQKIYDVIINEPSNPWVAGVASLFTREFYQEARNHLSENGIMLQWFHSYEMNDELTRMTLRTFASVFPHVTVWNAIKGDYFILGSAKPLTLQGAEAVKRFEIPGVKEDLARVGITRLETVLALETLDGAQTAAWVARFGQGGRIHEDRFPYLEYEAPKAFFAGKAATGLASVDQRFRPLSSPGLLLTQWIQEHGGPTSLSADAAGEIAQYVGRFLSDEDLESQWLRALLEREPGDETAWTRLARIYETKGNIAEAAHAYGRATAANSRNWETWWNRAQFKFQSDFLHSTLIRTFDLKQVLSDLDRSLELAPGRAKPRVILSQARAYREAGQTELMFKKFDEAISALKLDPGSVLLRNMIFEDAIRSAKESGRSELEAKYTEHFKKMRELE